MVVSVESEDGVLVVARRRLSLLVWIICSRVFGDDSSLSGWRFSLNGLVYFLDVGLSFELFN